MEDRNIKLAKIICDYSISLQKDEKVWIEWKGKEASPLIQAIVEEVTKKGAIPFLKYTDDQLFSPFLEHASETQLKHYSELDESLIKQMNAYIGIRANDNIFDLADVDGNKKQMFQKHYSPRVTDYRVKHTKWVVLKYPNNSLAQLSQKSTKAFTEFYYKVCTLDYSVLSKAMDPLLELMSKTDIVHIKGPGTDLTFSIKGVPCIKCDGKYNIPDGEVFTAPVRESMNGTIAYNVPSVYSGLLFSNVKFEVKNGKIIKAESSNSYELNRILDTDEGSRYFGEFAIGLNPYVNQPMMDILFDEKIYGSIHLTPGKAYEDADNGNHSAVHWDLVLSQTPEFGGGEIYFDGKLIRKDGNFVINELKGLNKQ